MKTSQKQNILRHLLHGPLCGQERDWTLGNRISARIYDLREKRFLIGKRHCQQGHEHLSTQWEFYIEERATTNHENWCADCGPMGVLRHVDRPIVDRPSNSPFWLPVECDKCGKGDWR